MSEETEQKSVESNEIKENGRLGTFIHRVRELPSNYRMALVSSWRNKERGLAVPCPQHTSNFGTRKIWNWGQRNVSTGEDCSPLADSWLRKRKGLAKFMRTS